MSKVCARLTFSAVPSSSSLLPGSTDEDRRLAPVWGNLYNFRQAVVCPSTLDFVLYSTTSPLLNATYLVHVYKVASWRAKNVMEIEV